MRLHLTKTLARFAAVLAVALATGCGGEAADDPPAEPAAEVEARPVVYQLVVRLFGNIQGTNTWNGGLVDNGVGKFAHIDRTAIAELKDLGATHIWLTGVLQQATATDYSTIGQPADDPDVLKGKAGSFYAIRDYFDVSPDYALDPADRLDEFAALLDRIHAADLKVVIDFVPNHVARTYHSDIRPELDFGAGDDRSVFYAPNNNYFYLVDPPGQALSLPALDHWPRPAGADGTLESEDNDGQPAGDVPRVTGNDVTSAQVGASDWYETIKLNYGYDFTTGQTDYELATGERPDTWQKMDAVLAYWQELGVDGFRCDFAHLVPVEAWAWLIARAEQRDPDVFFFAEAYQGAGGPPGFSFENFIAAGFDAVYDDHTYDTIKGVFCCGKWANDLDEGLPSEAMFDRFLRYAENHDERRIASPLVAGQNPDDSGFGHFAAGRPVAGTLYLLGSGPILIYNGQEVGEEAAGAEGFGGDDGRTSIFDYWTMPRVAEWVNGYAFDGGGLSEERRQLRRWYADLIALAQEPGFASGYFYGLQGFNADTAGYTGGQSVYSFLRYDPELGANWLVVANYADQAGSFDLHIPSEALQFMGLPTDEGRLVLEGRLGTPDTAADLGGLGRLGVPVSVGAQSLAVYSITAE